MQPIHELLNRIHWDPEFGCAKFEIGYYDRLDDTIIRVPFNEIIQMPDNKFAFQVMDEDGIGHSVPLHRVREVFRDGVLIWQRKPDFPAHH
jgi:uncharacterized protein (UPF0248 family)